jgi:ubiquinone/menaquinone biosynthesis C-methylase UbiE
MNLRPASLLYRYLLSTQYDLHRRMMRYRLSGIRTLLTGQWLDVGAGEGPYRDLFSTAGEYLTTNTRRHYSQAEAERLSALTTYWIEDGKSLPLPDATLDGVASFQVLSVIAEPELFFREINRVLKPGGKLVLSTDFLYPVWSSEDRYRHTAYSLRCLCEATGFKVSRIESFGSYGSAAYAQFMRFMRSFPELWKKKSLSGKLISLLPYLLLLLLMPLFSVGGMFLFSLEKNTADAHGFTFNLLLVAEKTDSAA